MRKILMASAGALVLVASPAAARNGAWYVGGDFGGMIVQDIQFDFGAPNPPQVKFNENFGYDGGLFVGYDLGAFRIEAEGSYKSAGVDKIDTTFAIPPPAGPEGPGLFPAGGGRTSALSFMVNGMLDFGDDNGTSGFVGGGVGVARVSFNNVRLFSNQAPYIDDSDTRFAWQVFAGVRQAVSDNIDITLKYRFFNVSGLSVDDEGHFRGDTRFRSHSLLGGIAFNFGAPPPPPPPPPSPPQPPEVQTTVPPPPLPPAEVVPPQQPPGQGEKG